MFSDADISNPRNIIKYMLKEQETEMWKNTIYIWKYLKYIWNENYQIML